MNPIQTYLGSLEKDRYKYGGLFSGISAPSLKKKASVVNTPTTPVQSSTPSSTGTTPTVVNTPANKTSNVVTTPKDQFVNNLAGGNTGSTQTSTKTPGQLADEAEMNRQRGGSAGSTSGSSETSYLDAYRDYLSQYASSLKPSDEVAKANKNLADISSKIDERSLKARREYEATLDTPGMLKAGAEAAARQGERRNASELADLAVVQGGAARSVEALTGNAKANSDSLKAMADLSKPLQIGDTYIDPKTGKIVYEKPKEAFNLSEGQVRYEFDPVTGQYKQVAAGNPSGSGSGLSTTSPGTGKLSPLAQAVQNGTISIEKIPIAQRDDIAAELATFGAQSGRQQTLDANLGVVNELLSNKSIGAISGVPALTAFLPGTSAQLAKNQYNQLKGILSLENREKLKGSGAISDFEFKVLSEAATALGRNLKDTDFKKQLEKIRDVFEGKYAMTNAGATNGAPSVNSGSALPAEMQLPDGTIVKLQADGTYQ